MTPLRKRTCSVRTTNIDTVTQRLCRQWLGTGPDGVKPRCGIEPRSPSISVRRPLSTGDQSSTTPFGQGNMYQVPPCQSDMDPVWYILKTRKTLDVPAHQQGRARGTLDSTSLPGPKTRDPSADRYEAHPPTARKSHTPRTIGPPILTSLTQNRSH